MLLLKQYFVSYNWEDLESFFAKEVAEKGWDIFNFIFLRKAMDMSLDKDGNEREMC